MEANSEGYTIHLSFEEMLALTKFIGYTSIYYMETVLGMTYEEAKKVQDMYGKLCKIVPVEQ